MGMDKEIWNKETKKLESRINYRVKKLGEASADSIHLSLKPYVERELSLIYGNFKGVPIRT